MAKEEEVRECEADEVRDGVPVARNMDTEDPPTVCKTVCCSARGGSSPAWSLAESCPIPRRLCALRLPEVLLASLSNIWTLEREAVEAMLVVESRLEEAVEESRREAARVEPFLGPVRRLAGRESELPYTLYTQQRNSPGLKMCVCV